MLDNIAITHADNFAVICYHTWWPGSSDPYYQFNIPENTARTNYYFPDYTPHLWLDGNVDAEWLSGTWEAKVTDEEAVPSPIAINLIVKHDNAMENGTIDAVISATEAITETNLKVRFAIVESDLPPHGYYTDPINHAMRDMLPDQNGLALTIAQGEVVTKSTSYNMDPVFVFENLVIVAFVQSDQNRRVLQAARFTLPGPSVTVAPAGSSVEVPLGGTLSFDATLANHSGNGVNGDLWFSVRLPSGGEMVIPESYLSGANPYSGSLPAWSNPTLPYDLTIPGSGIPIGVYTLIGRIGIYPDTVLRESSFDFEIY